eukprot:jgi/Ulvmu1/8942/UM005_0033.1
MQSNSFCMLPELQVCFVQRRRALPVCVRPAEFAGSSDTMMSMSPAGTVGGQTSRSRYHQRPRIIFISADYHRLAHDLGEAGITQQCEGRRVKCSATETASKHIKNPRPVVGNITPADNATQRLQRRDWAQQRADWAVLAPPSRRASSPAPLDGNAVVLVEGRRDATVVLRSVNAPVFIMGGTNSRKNEVALQKLQAVADAVPAVITLADPDAEGERFRGFIARQLGNKAWHAFLPVSRAIAGAATENHEAGNVGIEHAWDRDVAVALAHAQPYDAHAATYCRGDLEEWELVNSWDDTVTKHAALRREIVCNALGLARMDGNKLVKALNHYCFQRAQVERVLEFADMRLPSVVRLWDAMKSMRAEDAEHREAIDALVNKSADKFLYMLRRRAADALARGEIQRTDVIAYLLAYLEANGWKPSPDFAAALSDSFGSKDR